jgi:hypothetical protein
MSLNYIGGAGGAMNPALTYLIIKVIDRTHFQVDNAYLTAGNVYASIGSDGLHSNDTENMVLAAAISSFIKYNY